MEWHYHKNWKVFKGISMILLGAVILINEIYLNYDWWLLFGSLFIMFGTLNLFRGRVIDCCREEEHKLKSDHDETKAKKHSKK